MKHNAKAVIPVLIVALEHDLFFNLFADIEAMDRLYLPNCFRRELLWPH